MEHFARGFTDCNVSAPVFAPKPQLLWSLPDFSRWGNSSSLASGLLSKHLKIKKAISRDSK